MSLLQLLTTGRSLVGLKDVESRYRMTSQNLLPRFGGVKNPFCVTDKTVAPEVDARRVTERRAVSRPEPAAVAGMRLAPRESAESPFVAAVREPAAAAKAKGWNVASALRDRWTGKLSGLLSRPGGRQVRTAVLPPARVAEQGELSLERIRVVRNDLSDTDLEVVRAKAAVAPARRIAERGVSGATPWGWLAARVRGEGKT